MSAWMVGTGASRWIFWTGLTVGLAFVAGLGWWTGLGSRPTVGTTEEHPLEGLQVFGTVPPFSLVDRSGERVTRDGLMGNVWIVNFFYTHCPDTCPLQSAQMARLQRDFAKEEDLRLVSITVDPDRDTPAVLREYADRYGADAAQWLFLTGEKKAIYRLAREGFHLGAGFPKDQARAPAEGRTHPVAGTVTPYRKGWDSTQGRIRVLELVGRLLVPAKAWAHAEDFGQRTLPHSSRFVLVDRQARIRGYYPATDQEALERLRKDVRIMLRGQS
jgi:cytochrome oxidase Cu insertion factor (SCO1/SenC/PrrC family)